MPTPVYLVRALRGRMIWLLKNSTLKNMFSLSDIQPKLTLVFRPETEGDNGFKRGRVETIAFSVAIYPVLCWPLPGGTLIQGQNHLMIGPAVVLRVCYP